MHESPMSALERDLASGATVILDGATGTEIERRGAAMHHAAWCAMATLGTWRPTPVAASSLQGSPAP